MTAAIAATKKKPRLRSRSCIAPTLGGMVQPLFKPGADRGAQPLAVRAQAVVALEAHDLASGSLGRHPERVALALHDQHRHLDRLELGQARLLRPSRRVQREREA